MPREFSVPDTAIRSGLPDHLWMALHVNGAARDDPAAVSTWPGNRLRGLLVNPGGDGIETEAVTALGSSPRYQPIAILLTSGAICWPG